MKKIAITESPTEIPDRSRRRVPQPSLRNVRLLVLTGIVSLAVIQCGFSTDMLTTAPVDAGADRPSDSTDIYNDSASSSTDGEISDTGSDRGAETDTAQETESDSQTIDDEDSDACDNEEIESSEVLLIGDSWIALPGPRVGELARTDGILELNEDYMCWAVGGATIEDIVQQYDNYLAFTDNEIKAVIMNGGAVDTYATGASDDSISHVVETFSAFLSRLATQDIVKHIVYVLYSEGSTIPGVKELRPLMRTACDESTVPCHFIDLQPLWEGHPDYTSFDTINPSSDGSDAIAGEIWKVMQQSCVAQ